MSRTLVYRTADRCCYRRGKRWRVWQPIGFRAFCSRCHCSGCHQSSRTMCVKRRIETNTTAGWKIATLHPFRLVQTLDWLRIVKGKSVTECCTVVWLVLATPSAQTRWCVKQFQFVCGVTDWFPQTRSRKWKTKLVIYRTYTREIN